MQTVRGHLIGRVGDVLALVLTIALGIALGGVVSLGEVIEDRFRAAKPAAVERAD